MPFPIIVDSNGADRAQQAVVFVDYARQIHQLCDQLIPLLPAIDFKVFGSLIHVARLLKAEVDSIQGPALGPYARSVSDELARRGHVFSEINMVREILDVAEAVDLFLPAAIAAEPVDAETGCLLRFIRNAQTQEIESYVVDPAPTATGQLVIDLRAAFETV